MIGKLHLVLIASALSLTAFAASPADVTARPQSANCRVPNYPKAWIEDDLQGTVRLAVLVGSDGSVKGAKVVQSSGHRALDMASLRASSNCKFRTTPKDSDTATDWTTVQYMWVTE